MPKIKIPTSNPECEMYRKIDKWILRQLKQIEDINDKQLEVFWELNCKNP